MRYRREIDVAEGLIADPIHVLAVVALAFLVCFTVLGVTTAVFAWSGRASALALGFMASQRNLGLMLAATGGLLPDATWLWFALSQFPVYLAPQIMRPMVQLVLSRPNQVIDASR
jgi:hypothetical protein